MCQRQKSLMHESSLARFDHEMEVLERYYRRRFFVNVDKIWPRLEGLLLLVGADPGGRSGYLARFLVLVDELESTKSHAVASRNILLLGFCMQYLSWPEVGDALKRIHPRVPCMDRRLRVEQMIRSLYDQEWEGGECAGPLPRCIEWCRPDEEDWEGL